VHRSISEPAGAFDAAQRAAVAADGRGGLRRRSSLLSSDIAAARAAAVQQVHGSGNGNCSGGGNGNSGSGGDSPTIPEHRVRFVTITRLVIATDTEFVQNSLPVATLMLSYQCKRPAPFA
jgi:hypothetical protein